MSKNAAHKLNTGVTGRFPAGVDLTYCASVLPRLPRIFSDELLDAIRPEHAADKGVTLNEIERAVAVAVAITAMPVIRQVVGSVSLGRILEPTVDPGPPRKGETLGEVIRAGCRGFRELDGVNWPDLCMEAWVNLMFVLVTQAQVDSLSSSQDHCVLTP
jgi:hypothetical protein